MNLDIRQLLTGDVIRLRYINRWSTCRAIGRETVAEHTAFVVLFSLFVARWAQTHSRLEVDFEVLLTRAAVHDIEESRTGDFPRDFKHSSRDLRVAVECASHDLVRKIFTDIFGDSHLVGSLTVSWMAAKENDVEGRIIRFADFLSAVSFILEEGLLGNRSLGEHRETVRVYLKSFAEPQYDFIRPLVMQVEVLLNERIP